jgi:hypothetical protein
VSALATSTLTCNYSVIKDSPKYRQFVDKPEYCSTPGDAYQASQLAQNGSTETQGDDLEWAVNYRLIMLAIF